MCLELSYSEVFTCHFERRLVGASMLRGKLQTCSEFNNYILLTSLINWLIKHGGKNYTSTTGVLCPRFGSTGYLKEGFFIYIFE